MNIQKDQHGFTFIEILITLSILLVITTVSLILFRETVLTYTRSGSLVEIQENGSHALSFLERQLRGAENLMAYEDAATCTEDCESKWVLLSLKNAPEGACVYISAQTFSGATPDQWAGNGYLFYQEGENCGSLDTSVLNGDVTNDPHFGQAIEVTNRNSTDPLNGINLSNLTFTISTKAEAPATIGIELTLRQGVVGNEEDPPAQYKVSETLETTVTLR